MQILVGSDLTFIGSNCISASKALDSKIPDEIQSFIDDPKSKGTIYIAFGTFAKWDFAPQKIIDAYLQASEELKEYQIIFAYNGKKKLKKKFIANENLTVKVKGIFKIENPTPSMGTVENFRGLWNTGFKDFSIIIEKKEIKVHKNILAHHSLVFNVMFNSGMKESIENKLEIIDFSFGIVEKTVKLCYGFHLLSDFSNDECFLLLKFADKYNMAIIQDFIESSLCAKISVSNVCEFANSAIATNSFKLQNQCMNFLVNCLFARQLVSNIEVLDRDFQRNVFVKFCSHESL
uniref:BTB domain-containing protein n=1 Tax=Panagrolaimus sp. ES5 TaxID=591445 RepID=A0AC34G5N3_9BILA